MDFTPTQQVIIDEWNTLDNKQKVIKVATFCGWRRRYVGEREMWINKNDERAVLRQFIEIPNYFLDLNAMLKIEQKYCYSEGGVWCAYENNLKKVCKREHTEPLIATSQQRALAFVLTMSH